MDTKQMYVADINLVFGKQEEPMLKRMDDIILPALNSGLKKKSSDTVEYFFEDVKIMEINGEYILGGILIKDTVLEVKSEYKDSKLNKTDKRLKSSPYSVFMIFLKNHRMLLVKNQKGSPDIRGFSSSLREIIKEYIKNNNQEYKEDKSKQLPHLMLNVAGIKTAQSVRNALKDVESITELTFKFYPLNSEWDYDDVFGGIDEKIRKTIDSKKGKMVFPSPKNINGVAEIIEGTEGMVKSEMKVRYKSDASLVGTKKRGKIKDNEISEVMNIDIENDLDNAFEEIYDYKKDISALNVQSDNNLIDYQEYLERRKR